MELVQLYNKQSIYRIEELIQHSFISMSSNRVSSFYSIVLKLSNTETGREAEQYLETKLNSLVDREVVKELRIYSPILNTTYILIKPLISKSSEMGKDTFQYYEPDECTITITLLAKTVQRQN